MNPERLVEMANDIAAFFQTEPRADAIAGVKSHLKRFWEPRMRRDIVAHLNAGGTGLDELARAAVESLKPEVTATGTLKT